MQSIKNLSMFAVISFVLFTGVSMGPSAAYASDGFDTGWFDESEYYTPDTGWFDDSSYYTPDTGWFDESEYYTPETGWYDESEYYTPETGWYDQSEYYYPESGYEYPEYSYDYGCTSCGGSYGGDYYGGGYSYGGGYGFTPVSGYPMTIYKPTYTTPSKPTPSTPSNTVVNNNTNNNSNVNVNNNTAIAVAQVQISGQTATQPTYPHYPTYPAPYCTISHTQYTAYNYGTKQIYLSWTSHNASSAYLSGYGSVAVNGSQTVYSAANQTYTLTVYGYNGQQATCQTTVYGTTYTPTPYVSLTQIPYTGFDFGPFGNAMYWAGLVTVALAGAYLAVYYIPGLAFAGSTKRAFAPVVAAKAPILAEKEAALGNLAPIVASVRKAGTSDAMAIVKSTDGSMPKIVIERF